MRALRVLIACLVVTLSAGPAGTARFWTDTAVLVAQTSSVASAAPAASGTTGAPRSGAREAPAVAVAAAPRAPRLVVEEAQAPAHEAPDGSLVEDRYLRNCALLC